MLNLKHKKLDVWKASVEFVPVIYMISDHFPKSEQFGMVTQIRRAAVSISSNIAEGASRHSQNDRKRFFEIARSSLVEIDTQIEIAEKLDYLQSLSAESLSDIEDKMARLFAMLTKLIEKT